MTERDRMKIRYLGGRPVEVTGTVTGASYRFSASSRVQLLDPRDAVSVARSRAFRVEGVVRVQVEDLDGGEHG